MAAAGRGGRRRDQRLLWEQWHGRHARVWSRCECRRRSGGGLGSTGGDAGASSGVGGTGGVSTLPGVGGAGGAAGTGGTPDTSTDGGLASQDASRVRMQPAPMRFLAATLPMAVACRPRLVPPTPLRTSAMRCLPTLLADRPVTRPPPMPGTHGGRTAAAASVTPAVATTGPAVLRRGAVPGRARSSQPAPQTLPRRDPLKQALRQSGQRCLPAARRCAKVRPCEYSPETVEFPK